MTLNQTDYSVVVKHRAPPPKSWRWEIYRAGRTSPIVQSPVYFQNMTMAIRAGKEALKELLDSSTPNACDGPWCDGSPADDGVSGGQACAVGGDVVDGVGH
jgi:hypothetical protein